MDDPAEEIKQILCRLAEHRDAMDALRARDDLTSERKMEEFWPLFEEVKAIHRDLDALIERIPQLRRQ